ncbi:hypothetical protein [Flavivirga eckloniae]|uniref:Uncharacterized protein n=1 Tax=Flavivirga eckloniae TaxID=1803846 RepID=A0A2K9PUE8_9FLAO|nr:hypothetical protein [Flavivirga eckloniae]AUP80674.1 hypothetical protein C1H87_18930 [Flavivirga eckloniae]
MNIYLLIAGILCFILGLSHSILGELLIFQHKKGHKKIVPTIVKSDLKERHLRIIWATWHLASFLGWCIGAILIKIALKQNLQSTEIAKFIISSITVSMLCSSFLVLIGTKGKHPGWVVFLVIGILTLTGTSK